MENMWRSSWRIFWMIPYDSYMPHGEAFASTICMIICCLYLAYDSLESTIWTKKSLQLQQLWRMEIVWAGSQTRTLKCSSRALPKTMMVGSDIYIQWGWWRETIQSFQLHWWATNNSTNRFEDCFASRIQVLALLASWFHYIVPKYQRTISTDTRRYKVSGDT